jgi:DNA-binding NtrC family response regulator
LPWVDDNPGNNRYEIKALRALGFTIATATTNEEARRAWSERQFDAVISDIRRGKPESPEAGLQLPHALDLRASGTPIVFYVGTATGS